MTTVDSQPSWDHSVQASIQSNGGIHVILGTGQVGQSVARVLCAYDVDVRVVNRSGDVPNDIEPKVEALRADMSNPDAARAACEDASVVYFCLQPPYDRWPELFPPLLETVLNAVAQTDGRFVLADNLYAYGPVSGPINEEVPTNATGPKGKTRARMAETVLKAHESGRTRTTIGRASDLYGPGITSSIAGKQLFRPIRAGGTVWFPGDPDLPHTYTYIHDFARALVVLGSRERALGRAWHVPSAKTLSTREFVELASDVAGTEPTVRRLPSWLVESLGFVSSTFRQLRETQYQRSAPFVVTHEDFAAAFDYEPTPHSEALDQTIAWYRAEA